MYVYICTYIHSIHNQLSSFTNLCNHLPNHPRSHHVPAVRVRRCRARKLLVTPSKMEHNSNLFGDASFLAPWSQGWPGGHGIYVMGMTGVKTKMGAKVKT